MGIGKADGPVAGDVMAIGNAGVDAESRAVDTAASLALTVFAPRR